MLFTLFDGWKIIKKKKTIEDTWKSWHSKFSIHSFSGTQPRSPSYVASEQLSQKTHGSQRHLQPGPLQKDVLTVGPHRPHSTWTADIARHSAGMPTRHVASSTRFTRKKGRLKYPAPLSLLGNCWTFTPWGASSCSPPSSCHPSLVGSWEAISHVLCVMSHPRLMGQPPITPSIIES